LRRCPTSHRIGWQRGGILPGRALGLPGRSRWRPDHRRCFFTSICRTIQTRAQEDPDIRLYEFGLLGSLPGCRPFRSAHRVAIEDQFSIFQRYPFVYACFGRQRVHRSSLRQPYSHPPSGYSLFDLCIQALFCFGTAPNFLPALSKSRHDGAASFHRLPGSSFNPGPGNEPFPRRLLRYPVHHGGLQSCALHDAQGEELCPLRLFHFLTSPVSTPHGWVPAIVLSLDPLMADQQWDADCLRSYSAELASLRLRLSGHTTTHAEAAPLPPCFSGGPSGLRALLRIFPGTSCHEAIGSPEPGQHRGSFCRRLHYVLETVSAGLLLPLCLAPVPGRHDPFAGCQDRLARLQRAHPKRLPDRHDPGRIAALHGTLGPHHPFEKGKGSGSGRGFAHLSGE